MPLSRFSFRKKAPTALPPAPTKPVTAAPVVDLSKTAPSPAPLASHKPAPLVSPKPAPDIRIASSPEAEVEALANKILASGGYGPIGRSEVRR